MKINIIDIAKISGVSKSTVSRYLNGGSVSKKSSEKIKAAIEATGYETNIFASRLKRQKSNLIGVYMKGIGGVSVNTMLSEINNRLRDYNCTPFILFGENDNEVIPDIQNLNSLAKQGVDGIIFGTDHMTKELETEISNLNIPVILLGQESNEIPFCKVNNYLAGKLMGEYTAKKGHKNIIFVGLDKTDIEVGENRKKGLESAYKDLNISYTIRTFETDYSFNDSYKKAKNLKLEDATLIVCGTDAIAMGIMLFFNENGIHIPEDISIVGFGNYEYSKVVYPSLTTIDFDYRELAGNAVEDMIAMIKEEPIEKHNDVKITLIERKSVKTLK